ncbi:MAG: GFA family protein [Myxococcales bacterium]|nr:GFA family protein [Myxococcales bacterium]
MKLEGSCHCGKVRFRLESHEPVPYQRCYCSICRKTGGAGGYMINLGGDAKTLEVDGGEHVRIYRATLTRKNDAGQREEYPSRHERHFCGECGSHLWAFNSRWPELVHPVSSAIDSELPRPPENTHMMLDSKASWVEPSVGPNDRSFAEYPDTSLAQWHADHGLTSE